MVKDIGVLALPGTMFMPDGDAEGRKQLRIAFANVDRAGIAALFDRLATDDIPFAATHLVDGGPHRLDVRTGAGYHAHKLAIL